MIIYIAILFTWFLTAMWFLRRRHQLREKLGPAYFIIVGIVLGGIVLDAVFQWIIAPAIFLGFTKDILFTGRMQRYREEEKYKGTWRMRAADWICENLLNPYDPSGKHC